MFEDIKTRPLSLSGLNGRELTAGQNAENPILLLYGIHSSMERMASMAEFLADFGQVTLPDLPGIGGMSSFYKIGLVPTLENYSDYLYAYLKSKRIDKPMVVVAMSFGFLVVTRMLQKYPDSRQWIRDVVSFVGFGRSKDFKVYSENKIMLAMCLIFSTRFGGWLVKTFVFNPLSLRIMFGIFKLFNPKYKHAQQTNPEASLKMELNLWQVNDARTRFAIYDILFHFDLTKTGRKLEVPLHDVTTPTDQYFDPQKVTTTLRKIYRHVDSSPANMALHAPSIIGNKRDVAAIFSNDVKKILAG